MMSALLLWLEGPLQSWGADSRYGNRTTLPFPTRSGVLGLLCCAAGRGGEQREWLAAMAARTQTVRAYARRPARGMAAAPPLLTDFQMVGSGYDDGDAWQNLMVPKTSEGKKPVGSGAKMTSRHYVQDMAFACVLELPRDEASALADALTHPVWELSLGRRNCPPSARIGRGVFASEEEALAAADELADGKGRIAVLTVRDGAHDDGDEVWTIRDVPLRFGTVKQYRERQVTLYR